MNPNEPSVAASFKNDIATLKEVFTGLEHLEELLAHARQTISPRNRGYFTPDEDNEIRRLLLAYRNYRITAWDIIRRNQHFQQSLPDAHSLAGFMLAYSAAIRLYSKSLRLIEIAEFDPMLRAKLNEPDSKFDLPANTFEHVLISYSSSRQYLRMLMAGTYWITHRRKVRSWGLASDPLLAWLVPIIDRERSVLHGRFWSNLRKRLRRDWRAAWRTLFRPIHLLSYGSRVGLAAVLSDLRVRPGHVRGLGPAEHAQLFASLQVGDVLLTRADDKATATLLPGFWSHAAIYIGSPETLQQSGLDQHPLVQRFSWLFKRYNCPLGYVIEAVPRGCRLHSLARCLEADHVLVLRPQITTEQADEAVIEAYHHLGKAYDFEFDFNVSSRVVCTELIYRCLHGRGTMHFSLIKRLGRYTLTADDLVEQFLSGSAAFTSAQLLLKQDGGVAQSVPESERTKTLIALLSKFKKQ